MSNLPLRTVPVMSSLSQLVLLLLLSLTFSRKVHLHLSLPDPGEVQPGEDYGLQEDKGCKTNQDCGPDHECSSGVCHYRPTQNAKDSWALFPDTSFWYTLDSLKHSVLNILYNDLISIHLNKSYLCLHTWCLGMRSRDLKLPK